MLNLTKKLFYDFFQFILIAERLFLKFNFVSNRGNKDIFILIFLYFINVSSIFAQICGTSGQDGPQNAFPPVNTYFPLATNVSLPAGSKSITLLAVPPNDPNFNVSYGVTPIKSGDLILIIQMQDAEANFANSNLYGSGSATNGSDGLGGTGYTNLGNSGKFEYVVATSDVSLTGGLLKFRGAGAGGGVVNSYTNSDFTATRGQRRFQIIRVPQYSTLVLSSNITTPPYNGSVGGIIAFDVAGTMQFNGFSVDASQRGFRGGYGPIALSGPNTSTVYAALSSSARSVGKGEGIAGTPRYVWDGFNQVDNGAEGLPGGSYGRGAPGNAGGGGNDHNAGGGGGGNAGFGGIGGRGFQGVGGNLNPLTGGGRPGSSIPSDYSRLIMGGGGGGGDANDATSGIKGGVGGGIIIINVQKIEGVGTIISNGGSGEAGTFNSNSDGAGGGGAGGSIFVRSLAASPTANLIIQANGGKGGNALDAGINPHGPGGGGGGGFIYTQITSATITTNTVGGTSGKTFNGDGITHGATDGINGSAKIFTTTDLPTHLQGGGSICYPTLTTTLTEINAGAAGIRSPGSTATYKLKVVNATGVGNAGGVNADFQLPFGFTLSTVSVVLSGDAAGPTLPTFTVGASGKVTFGTYNISPGDHIEFTILVNISTTIPSGIYHASAQATYLDPTRTNINPVRKITANNNPFTGTNTIYETGGITNVPGANYNGNLNTSIVEDVYINAVPSASDCSAVINGYFTVATPGVYDGPNYLGSWKVVKPSDKVKIQASISDNSNNVAFIKEGFSLQQTIQTLKPSTNYSLNFKYIRNNVCDNISSESKIKVQILDATTLTVINGLDIGYNTAESRTGTIPFTTGASTTGIIIQIFDDNSPTNSCAILIDDVIITSPIDFQIQKTNVSCNGASDGSFSVVALSGGVGPYNISYSSDNGITYSTPVSSGVISVSGTPYTVTGLPAGAYKIRISDQNGCGDPSKDITINQPNVLDLTGSNTTILCNGSTSTVTLSATGGTAPYRYSIDNGVTFQTQNTFPNLLAGSYTFLVRDANNCSDTYTVSITEPIELTLSVVQNSPIICFDGSTSVTLTAGGGTGIYEYSLDGISYQAGNTFLNVLAGNQTLRVRDINGCITNKVVTISEPAELILLGANSAITCNGGTSTVTLTGSGGTGAYQYSKDGSTFQPSSEFSNLLAGTHIFTIKDVNNCLGTDTVIITQPAALSLSGTSTPTLCNGGPSTVTLTGSGGTGAYLYSKDGSTFQTSNIFSNFTAGTHTFTIKDANNCTLAENIIISQPSPFVVNFTNTPILCNGGTSTITVNELSGATAPYRISYSYNGSTYTAPTYSGAINSSNPYMISGVLPGVYNVKILDANNCEYQKTLTITQPTVLTITDTQTNINCNGDSSGSINSNISGGTAPYTFNWSNGSTTLNQSNLPAGSYTITVTDANNCQTSKTITLIQPSSLLINASKFNVKCFGETTGGINISVTGGTAPYTYSWNNGATTKDLTGLTAGTYSLTVTDSKGCLSFATISITQPLSPITISETHINNTCFSENQGSIDLTVSGGVGPYLYSWNNGSTTQDINNLAPGNYTATITDANNCVATKTITITPLAPLAITNSQINLLCNNIPTGEIALNITGGTLPYVIIWNSGATSASLQNLSAGTYTYTVRDNNGCEITNNIIITEPPLLTLTGNNTTILCNGDLSIVTLNSTGGTGAYQYSKDGTTFQSSNIFSNLAAGTYTFNVKDANNCIKTFSITITQPVALAVTESHQNVVCFGQATGSINISVNGGTAPYTYLWNNGVTTKDLNGIIAGTYNVVITDAKGCVISKQIQVTQPNAPLSITDTREDVKCFGDLTGKIDISVSGGTAPYSYLWINGITTQDITNVPAGTYSVIVTDANRCVISRQIQITQPVAPLSLTETHVDNICFGDKIGAINVSVSGGTAPYTYKWNTGQSTQDLTNLAGGLYILTVTDANNCTKNISVTITPLQAFIVSESMQNVKCFNESTGSINLNLSGGKSPYTVTWSNGATGAQLSNLKAGNYTYKAVDAYGCTIQKTIIITQPQPLAATFIITNTTCKFSPDGAIVLNVTGGVAPFKYTWNGLDRGPNASLINISSGKYIIVVTDANSCSIIVSTEVLPGNCAPNAGNDKYTTNEDTPITIKTPGVIINDDDPDQDELKIMLSTVRDPNSSVGNVNGNTSSFTTVNGGVLINNNGSFTYTPKKNFSGIERFVYKVSDGSLLSNFATVTIEVLAVNDPPIAVDDNYSTLEDTPFDGTVIPNDSDPDADPLTYRILARPNNAVVSFNADGTFRFVPVLNFNGTITFDYQVCDPFGLCDTAKVTVIVTTVNDPPVALDDTFKTQINLPFNNRVTDNDSDVDNDPLQYSALTQPANGTLVFNTDGTFIYTPRNGFKGTDTFTYRTCDPAGLCDDATVSILVQPIVTVNLTPSTATIKEGEKISITAVLTESIFEDATVTIAFGGSATNNSDYTLTGNFVTITILAGQTTTTQEFTINAINDALRDDGEQVIANVTATSTPYVLIGTGSFINITDIYPISIPLKPEENPDINPDPLVSPNRDGQGNDKFIIYNIGKYPDNEVLIFNRWGNEVFKIAGYNNDDKAFEGIANAGILTNTSKELVDAVYYYVIYTTANGVKNINRGYLILKR